MGYEDRSWYRDGNQSFTNPLLRAVWWLAYGQMRLFEIFGITVRVHASLIVVSVLLLLFGLGFAPTSPEHRIQFVTVLWVSVLLHEFGHCWGSRRTGGNADEILLTPLGGLAFTQSRHKWSARFITVLCGPLVTFFLYLIAILGIWSLHGRWVTGPWNFGFSYPRSSFGLTSVSAWLFWIATINWGMLVFNLLPIWPLDGGQMVQTIVWKWKGYYRSMMFALTFGMAGNMVLIMVGLAGGPYFGGWMSVFIGLSNIFECYNRKRFMLAEGPWAFPDDDSDTENVWKIHPDPKPSMFERLREKRDIRRAEKERRAARQDERALDALLSKISKSGIDSLSSSERKELERLRQRKATSHK